MFCKSLLPFQRVFLLLLLGEGLKTSATNIVIIYYQNVLQAILEPDIAMNVRLQRGKVFSSQLHQRPPKSFAVTLRLEAVRSSENGTINYYTSQTSSHPQKKSKDRNLVLI
jgi:hypothetical protein